MDRRGYPPPEAFGRGESQRRFNRKITGALHCLCHTQGTRLETVLNSAAEGEGEMSNSGIVRYFEFGGYGERTGRQLLIKADTDRPNPAEGAQWRIDPHFNAGDEILKSSGFSEVLASVLKNGYKIV